VKERSQFKQDRSIEGFELGQVWRTKAGELWCVLSLHPVNCKVGFVVLYSKHESMVGKLSWSFPTRRSITLWQRVS